MAITLVEIQTPSGLSQFTDSAMGNAADGVKGSSAVVYSVLVNNTGNSGNAVYVKLYNNTSGNITVGTSSPDEVIYVPASAIVTHFFYTGSVPGVTFATGLTACCVTSGGTSGTTSPSSSVSVTVNFV